MIKKFLTMLALACLTATGAYADGPALTPTANENEWTFTMPAYDAELKVTYYTDQDYANDVTNLIAAIGAFEPTSACKAKIDAARAAYDALTDDQKALVANYDVLEAVEADYNAYYHVVSLADGTVDAESWTAKAGEGDFAALPLKDVMSNTVMTVKYGGEKKVKSVKAADMVSIKFEANGNSKIVKNVKLPHTFVCDSNSADGDFDQILRELYGWPYDLANRFCNYSQAPSSTDANKVDAKLENDCHTFTISSAFEGAVTVTGKYRDGMAMVTYSVDISIVASQSGPELTPTENENEWTFTMPADAVKLNVAYYTEDELAAMEVEALIAAIGEVAYTAESKALIDAARERYEGLGAAAKALVENYNVLTTAETVYAAAEDALYTEGVELTDNGNGSWTLAATPAFDVELEVTYYTEDELAAMEVAALIDAIGEVAYTDESKDKIDNARAAYDKLTAGQKALVANYATLETAEKCYNAAAFDAYKAEQIATVEAMAQAGDSDNATALIAAAKAAIEAIKYDSTKMLDENKAAVGALVSKLAEDLASSRSVNVEVIINAAAQTDIKVTPGQVYTDEVIEEITKAAEATATRHGLAVTGWQNADGSEVTGKTIVGKDDKLTAVWEEVNPLVPETQGAGAVNNAKSLTYDAYVLNAAGTAYGTVKVTVGKDNKNGLASVQAVVTPNVGGNAMTFKATEAKGGKATLSDEAASTVELACKDNTMTLVIGAEGVRGSCTIAKAAYGINGSLNRTKTDKTAYNFWKGARAAASADETGAIVATFTIEVKARGKVSAKGRFANGKTTSANSQLMVADDGGEASVAIKGSKKIPFAAVVWFGKDGTVTVESITTSVAKGVKCVATGKAGGLAAGGYTLQSGNLTAPLAFNGSKFQRSSAANVTSHKTATGVFSGNYKDASGEAKKGKVDFGGVVIDGIGYGTTKSGASVTITPAAK